SRHATRMASCSAGVLMVTCIWRGEGRDIIEDPPPDDCGILDVSDCSRPRIGVGIGFSKSRESRRDTRSSLDDDPVYGIKRAFFWQRISSFDLITHTCRHIRLGAYAPFAA